MSRKFVKLAAFLPCLLLLASATARADGEDDNCSAAEGWPKPAHCGSHRNVDRDGRSGQSGQGSYRAPLDARIVCGSEASSTAAAVKSLNEILDEDDISEGRQRFVFKDFSLPAFSTVGNRVTACVTARGSWVDKIPG